MRTVFAIGLVVLMLGDAAEGAQKRKRRSTRNRTAAPAVVLDAASVNDPATLSAGPVERMAAPGIVRLQILLDRANVSVGEIDGRPGANLSRAITGFQQKRKLQVTGQPDDATIQALNADTAPALVPYRISDADVAGPFVQVPADLPEQAKLPALGYENALEAIGEQFHASPGLLQRLNADKKFIAGEEINVPNVLGQVSGKAARVVVKKTGVLIAYDQAGEIIAHYPASSGSEHDPLPLGKWKINGVAKNPPFHYNPELFWDADPSHSKAKIPPGPNNPVGVVWIDLSKEHYGIHGTPQPGKVGHTQSHGCIRLTNWDAMELAALVGPGTPALLEE